MLQILLIAWLHIFHPFYVSVTEIRHNQQTQQIEVSVRIFFDDFEKSLAAHSKTRVNILQPPDRKKVDALIAGYLKTHLKIQVDGKAVALNYIGYEIEEDAAWCYFESARTSDFKELRIQNDILFAEHPTQTNMIHAIVGGKRQSTKLDNPEKLASFKY